MFEARVESCITQHAWNGDRTMLAVCPNDNTVILLKKPSAEDGQWERVATLSEHDALITDIAWAPRTNRIVTTSQDRNAYVWTQHGTEWKPMLVILRITAAATSVRWCGHALAHVKAASAAAASDSPSALQRSPRTLVRSPVGLVRAWLDPALCIDSLLAARAHVCRSPDEQKFAVGSGAKVVPVCYYEDANNFWVSKMIKEHCSTVCAVAWHPNAPIVATASTDFRCRVFSAFLKSLDPKESKTPWGPAAKFGTLLYTFEAHGWVLDVAFSADGDTLALCAQNSSVSFIDVAAAASGSATAAQTLRLSELPLMKLLFLADGTLVGAGHCFSPLAFCRVNGVWLLQRKLVASKSMQKQESSISVMRRMFQSHASTGRTESANTLAALETVHQFPVCGLQHFNSTVTGSPAEFTSSALDGKIVGWSSDELAGAMQAMGVG